MGACLAALLRGEETEEAEAGAVTLADAIHELRLLRQAMTATPKKR